MRAIILYAFVLPGSLAAWVAIQYGWRPPFAVVWDSLSSLIVLAVLWFLASLSSWGLAANVSVLALPRRLQLLPAFAAFLTVSFSFLGIANLSPALSASEGTLVVGASAGFGLIVGLLIGAAFAAANEGGFSDALQENNAKHGAWLMLVVAAACAAFLVLPRPRITPHVTVEIRFENEVGELTLGHGSLLGERYAFVGVASEGTANSLVLEPSEWRLFSSLIEEAEESQTDTWRVVGLVEERRTDDRSRLELSAGAGIRVQITPAHNPSTIHELQSSDFDSLNAASARVTTAIAQ